jgi:hypothetical protein
VRDGGLAQPQRQQQKNSASDHRCLRVLPLKGSASRLDSPLPRCRLDQAVPLSWSSRLFRPVTLRRHLSMALPLSENRERTIAEAARVRV